MKTFELNGYEIAVPEIPEGATDGCEIRGNSRGGNPCLSFYGCAPAIILPPGDWQIYQLESVPEELAGEMVDVYDDEHDCCIWYKDYIDGRFAVMSAHASLTSFFHSHGVKENPYLLIKNNPQ